MSKTILNDISLSKISSSNSEVYCDTFRSPTYEIKINTTGSVAIEQSEEPSESEKETAGDQEFVRPIFRGSLRDKKKKLSKSITSLDDLIQTFEIAKFNYMTYNKYEYVKCSRSKIYTYIDHSCEMNELYFDIVEFYTQCSIASVC